MQSLNAQFKQAIVENLYNYSNFDGKQYPLEELQICHILSKSKRTLNSIKKAYNCSDKMAEIIMNMPLLNTVVGSREQNKAYCKTEDITFIDKKIVYIAYFIFKQNKLYENVELNNIFIASKHLSDIESIIKFGLLDCTAGYNFIQSIQLQFHQEIDLHF